MPELIIEGAPTALVPLLEGATVGLLAIAVPIFGIELVRLLRRGALDRARIRGMVTSAFCLVPYSVAQLVVTGAVGGLFLGAAYLTPLSIPTTWLTALACLVLIDLAYYWEHRLSHEVGWFWAGFHATHHSANHYDQTIGLRVSFAELFLNWLALGSQLALVAMGFHPLLVLGCYGLMLAWQQWIHTETVGRLPWLDGWLNTPSNHRVHHGRNPEYLDRNYGGLLMVWDRLFGTYAPETVPVEYGLVERLESDHPLAVHFSAWASLGRRLAATRSLGQAVRVVLGPPGPADA